MWRVKPIGLALLVTVVTFVVLSVGLGIVADVFAVPPALAGLAALGLAVWGGWRTWQSGAARARPPEQRIPHRFYAGRLKKD